MTGNSCLLDTSIVIQSFRKDNVTAQRLDMFSSVYISTVVQGELYYGAYRSSNTEKNLGQINKFLMGCVLLRPDGDTAVIYGKVKAQLAGKGKPIPENDIWIEALALQHNLPLYTIDKHFSEVATIKLVV